jgi:hypothetical protein
LKGGAAAQHATSVSSKKATSPAGRLFEWSGNASGPIASLPETIRNAGYAGVILTRQAAVQLQVRRKSRPDEAKRAAGTAAPYAGKQAADTAHLSQIHFLLI